VKYLTAVFLLFLSVVTPARLNAQVTSNVIMRVLHMRVSAGTDHEGMATAFTIDVDGREYLITAKHVVQGLKENDKIDIFMNGGWSSLNVSIFRCDDPVDIAVLIPPRQLTVNFELPFESQLNFLMGQDAYFLGFPYGLQAPGGGTYPIAIIKRGTISASIPMDISRKKSTILLDGENNPGFSGGPIVFRDLNKSQFVLNLAGVVSGFIPEVVSVMKRNGIKSPDDAGNKAKAEPWRIQKGADGTYFEYVDTDVYVPLNTGIVIGYTIAPAIDLIRQHPMGPVVKDLSGN
jgi:hypothetical protein